MNEMNINDLITNDNLKVENKINLASLENKIKSDVIKQNNANAILKGGSATADANAEPNANASKKPVHILHITTEEEIEYIKNNKLFIVTNKTFNVTINSLKKFDIYNFFDDIFAIDNSSDNFKIID